MTDGPDVQKLACDMIDVHGTEAAAVARENARTAALAGQVSQAKSWIKVLGTIQRQQAGKVSTVEDASPKTAPGTDASNSAVATAARNGLAVPRIRSNRLATRGDPVENPQEQI